MTLGRRVQLAEFCEIKGGGRQGLSGKDFVEYGFPAYGAGGLNGRVPVAEYDRAGVVLSSIGARCGKCFHVDSQWSSLANTQVILPDPVEADSRFLWYQLNDESRWPRSGTGQPFIKPSDVKAHWVWLPPLGEQRRIAAILDQADALRSKRREAIAHLDDLTQSIFLDMFGDPVANPRGWPVRALRRLGQLNRGVSRHRPRNDPSLLGGRHPLVQTGEVANSGGYIREFTSTYSDLGLAQSKMWPAGTLCITIAANIAKTGILTFDACFPDSVVGFTADPATTQYVRVWLGFLQATLERAAPQSAQKNINLAILRSLPLPVPPAENLEQFLGHVERLETATGLARNQAATIDRLFESLQSRAFAREL